VKTESNIPIAKGLKSSSVAGNAVVLATLDALGEQMENNEILNVVVDASLDAKVSITGAYDDAAASLYGNVVVTDNITRRLLRTYPLEEHCVILLVPSEKRYTITVDMERIGTVARQADVAFNEAFEGNYWNAMTLNGLAFAQVLELPSEIILESLEAGALAAGISGKGPAYAFVVREEFRDSVLRVLRGHAGEIIVSKTRRHPSVPMRNFERRGCPANESYSEAQ
jgi:shikimate kinase